MIVINTWLDADQDLYVIWLFSVERFGEEQADRYYYELFEQFERIADSPLQYPPVDHIRESYRRSVYRSHAIYVSVHPTPA